jgi:hypothetical protein
LDWSPLGPMGRLPEQEFATGFSVLFFLFVFFIIDQSNFGCKNNTFLSIKYAKIENVTSEKRVFYDSRGWGAASSRKSDRSRFVFY